MTRVARATAGERCLVPHNPTWAGGWAKENERKCYLLEYFWQSLRPVASMGAAGSQPLPGRTRSIRVSTDSPPPAAVRPSDLSV